MGDKWATWIVSIIAIVILYAAIKLIVVGELVVFKIQEQGQQNERLVEGLKQLQDFTQGATIFRTEWVDPDDPRQRVHIVEVKQQYGESVAALLVRYKQAIEEEERLK